MLRRVGHGCLLWALVLSTVLCAQEPGGEQAEPPDSISWNPGVLEHIAKQESITDLLREFASDQKMPIVLSEKVTGVVSGQFGPLHPRDFLDEITQKNGLIWTYDGASLYVYRSDEIKSEILPIRGVEMEEIIQALRQVGVWSSQYPIKLIGERKLIYVTGPPRYIETVTDIATKIQQQAARQANVEVVMKVFPLQYAWADDQAFTLSGNQIIVPGVATILRNLVNGTAAGGGGTSVQQIPRNLPGLRGQGLIGPYNEAIAEAAQSARSAEIAAAEANARASVVAPPSRPVDPDSPAGDLAAAVPTIIQADPRINAVLIRDVRDRIPEYEKLIRELDLPTGLVQIEASIIDVDADAGFEWTPDATFNWLKTDPSASVNVSTFPIGTGPAPNVSVRLDSAGLFNLLTRFRVLETEGQARLISRPTVLTINNMEATLNSQEEFFVRVSGFQQSDLFNVQVGTVLRIVPHIVDEGGFRRIKLIVTVEDGRQTEERIEDVPIISRNSINTQAVLNEGESLLIGGLIREEVSKDERRIPFVGKVPLIKHAFSSNETIKRRFERLVVITPKVIDLPDRNCMFIPPTPLQSESIPQSPSDIRQPPRNSGPSLQAPSLPRVPPPEPVPIQEARSGSKVSAKAMKQVPPGNTKRMSYWSRTFSGSKAQK
jgi:type III secretion protein C